MHHAIATSTDPSVMMLVGKGSKSRIEWCVLEVKCMVCYNIQNDLVKDYEGGQYSQKYSFHAPMLPRSEIEDKWKQSVFMLSTS